MNIDRVKEEIRDGDGFIAALDQSGGSAPAVLNKYGIAVDEDSQGKTIDELMHEFRTRIVTNDDFCSDKIMGTILYESTVDCKVDGKSTVKYLREKGINSFLKIDMGVMPKKDNVQRMAGIPGLFKKIYQSRRDGLVGIKARSVIHGPSKFGIKCIVEQQFQVANAALEVGVIPILEPEVLITSEAQRDAESILRAQLLEGLDSLQYGHDVILKLTLPSEDGFYQELSEHPRVLRVVALSGGYEQEEACRLLTRNPGTIASFSRALLEGLHVDQSSQDFNDTLSDSIHNIFYSQKGADHD